MSLVVSLLVVAVPIAVAATQNTSGSTKQKASQSNANASAKPRPPIFRATKEQVKQAQTLLAQRSFYAGEATGKLDEATRAALRKFQEAENLKSTGTLNAVTLEKMNIPLTEKQKAARQAAMK